MAALQILVLYVIVGLVLGLIHALVAPIHQFNKRMGYVLTWIILWPIFFVVSVYLGMKELTETEE